MATILAVQAGNWSNTSTWTGGVIPGANDIAMTNGKAVTIDTNISVTNVGCAAYGGAVSGGYFLVPSAVSIACSGYLGTLISNATDATGLFRCSHSAGTTIDVYANVSAVEDNYNTVLFRTSNTVGGITIHGSVIIPSTAATGGKKSIIWGAFSTITITGDVTGGTFVDPMYPPIDSMLATAVCDFQGTLTAKTLGRYAVRAAGRVNRVKSLVCGADGTAALYAPGILMQSGTQCTWTCMDDQVAAPFTPGQAVVLANFTSDSPPPEDVRAGKAYGPSATLTGTCAVPSPATVAAAIPVDATVGTAALLLSDVAAVTGAQIAAAVTA